MLARVKTRVWLLTALAIAMSGFAGCAGLRCPRIDPSGERLFVCSRDQVPPVAASANPVAPPVYTDPVFPQPALAGASPQVGGVVPPVPQDRLRITPQRVLAPVGSEVILRAGLCTRENYLLTDSKIEWLLARDEAGEFVELGGRGWCKDPWLPWNKPRKIDNQYAIGYTAKVPLSITRGTANTTDDVEVQPGEAWASVTSPVEGVSHVTAVAPEIVEWANRRAVATIYWVDVQWTFPPSAVTAGGGQVLTTTVLRQTDGTPLEGWVVRYQVADGAGALRGNQEGQVVEVRTDAEGRASIDVTPTGSAGSTTRINAQLVRPAGFGGSSAPQLDIASGSTLISWTDGDYVPPPDDLGDVVPPSDFPPGGSTTPIQPPTYQPPTNNVMPPVVPDRAQIGPRLEVEILDDPGSQIQVGGTARFEFVLRNTGDTAATGIILRDEFDLGLTNVGDSLGQNTIQTNPGTIPDIAAGSSYSLFQTFGVQKPGRLCQNVTVTYNGTSPATARYCIDVPQPQVQRQGRLLVTKQGPVSANVNQTATFTLSVRNVGDAPLLNVEVVDSYDAELQAQPISGAELFNGNLRWRIPRIEPNDTWQQRITCLCRAAKSQVCGTVLVTADTGTPVPALTSSDTHCLDILAPPANVTPNVVPPQEDDQPLVVPPTDGAAAQVNPNGLSMEIVLFSNPVTAGTGTRFQITLKNNATVVDQQVRLSVQFPAELRPDVAAFQQDNNLRAQLNNNGELQIDPIRTLRNDEKLDLRFRCNVLQPGVRNIVARLQSNNMPEPIQVSKEIRILGG